MRKLSAFPAVAILLSGCGGGGGASASLPAQPPGSPRLPTADAQVTVKVPSASTSPAARRGAYVPASVGSVRVSVVTVNGTAPSPAIPDVIQALTASTPGCSTATGPLICTVHATLPIGAVVLAVTVYQSTDGSGTPLSTSNVSATISGTAANSVNVTLGGVPATITLGGPFVAPADGTTKTFLMSVTAKDASGSTIIAPGNYSVPITLSVTGDPNAAVTLGAMQETAPSATGPNVVSVSYNSAKPLTSATITASATGATSATTHINPLVYSPTSLAAMVINGMPASVTVSEAGYGGAFTIANSSPIATTSCVPANCTPTSVGGQVTINVQPTNASGFVTMAVTDSNSVTANVPLRVASATGSLPIPGLPTFFVDPITTPATSPNFPVTGSDGRIWFAETASAVNKPAAMTTAGVVTEYGPFTGGITPSITGAALGPDGNMWYVDAANDAIQVVTPTGAISANSGAGMVSVLDEITAGPDGNMWFSGTTFGSPRIGVTRTSGSGLYTYSSGLTGTVTSLLAGTDGNVWFTQTAANAIGKITPGNPVSGGGVVTLYTAGLTGTPNPGLAIGSDNCLWFTESSPNAVVKVRFSSGLITEYTTGISATAGTLGGIAQGGDGNLWFAESGGSVARVTTNGVITEFPAGTGHVPNAMVLGSDGYMWFTEITKNTLGWLTY